MRLSIDVSDMNALHGRNAKRASHIKEAIQIILKKSTLLIERYAKVASPVKTGRMRASIGEGEGLVIGEKFAYIGPTVEYAKFVHKHVPFMEEGLQEAYPEITTMAQQEINKALK